MQKGTKVVALALACVALAGGVFSYAAQGGGGIQGPSLLVRMSHEPPEVCRGCALYRRTF